MPAEFDLAAFRARVHGAQKPRRTLGRETVLSTIAIGGNDALAILERLDDHATLREAVVEVLEAEAALRTSEREALAVASAAGRSAHEALEQLYERQRDQPERMALAWAAMRALVGMEAQS